MTGNPDAGVTLLYKKIPGEIRGTQYLILAVRQSRIIILFSDVKISYISFVGAGPGIKGGNMKMRKITPMLWYDKEAGEAAEFYASVFKGSRIKDRATLENTPSGTVEIVTVELPGQELRLMSAGPFFKFNEAVSFVVDCETQAEIDYYWEKLSADPKAEQCGWLKDKYGLSWQIVPSVMQRMLRDKDKEKTARLTEAFLKMKKLDIAGLERAFKGTGATKAGRQEKKEAGA